MGGVMSRELLKRAADKLRNLYAPPNLVREIDEYLKMPEPEPVAWRALNFAEHGGVYAYRDHDEPFVGVSGSNVGEPLYTTPPDQSVRIAELERSESSLKDAIEAAITDTLYYRDESESRLEGLMSATEANRRLIDKITSLEQQLAAKDARAIELAHGIKNCL